MSDNHIQIYLLGTDVLVQRIYDTCLMTHLALNLNFTTSELRAINQYRMSKGIFFISEICNHQGTHIQKELSDTDTTFNMIHDLNWPRRHHTSISSWRTWRKELRTLCDESRPKMRAPLGQWTLDDNKYITSWKCFLSRDLRTLH